MNYQIAVIPGDGIGPDVVEQTLKVMDKVGEKFGHTFHYTKVLAGGCAIDATGACLPQETIWAFSPTCVLPCCSSSWPTPPR